MSTIDRSRMSVVVQQTSQRVTPPPAGRQFTEALAAGGQAIVRAAVAAASHIPGVDVAAAALRGAAVGASDNSTPSAPSASVGGSTGSAGASANSGSVEGPAQTGTNAAAGAAGITGAAAGDGDLLSRGQEMSMRMLRLQEAMSEENRRYTALSNVMHARHEMSKNAINNIR
ncbi:MAG: hypothetical protein U0269_26990 [Polyangiales bacterium]